MDCPICNSSLRIGKSYVTCKNDDTPDKQTEVYQNLDMVCINPDCQHYAGTNLEQPNKVVETITSRIN